MVQFISAYVEHFVWSDSNYLHHFSSPKSYKLIKQCILDLLQLRRLIVAGSVTSIETLLNPITDISVIKALCQEVSNRLYIPPMLGLFGSNTALRRSNGLNIFYSGIKYTEKDWVLRKCDITLSKTTA